MADDLRVTIQEGDRTWNLHLWGREGRAASFETYLDDDTGYAEGSLWLKGGRVVDFDGIFALREPMVSWFRAQGVIIPKECIA